MTDRAAKTVPDTRGYLRPSSITPSIWWAGRSGWNMADLTPKPDCNIYLLKGREFDVLIDCGIGASLAELEDNIRQDGSDPARIREIWLTHSHLDHFVRAGYWAAKYPETVCRISRIALEYLDRNNLRLVGYDFFGPPPVDWTIPPRLLPLQEGSLLTCPPWELRVEELPGHVPDQIGFRGQVDGLQVLFCGDAALGDQGEAKGCIGWMDGYWLSSVTDLQKTLERLVADPPDLLLPGHGWPHAGASARRSLRNCLRRVQRFAALPELGGMIPFA